MFVPYKNLHGNSPVDAYEIHNNYISICFRNRIAYDYYEQKIGLANLQEMKRLAELGAGLSAFISRNKSVYYGSSNKRYI